MNDMNKSSSITDIPQPSAAEMRQLMAGELSLFSRLGYTALLLAALTATVVTGALLWTEAVLPARTQIALAVLVGIGLSWSVFAVWVLARRRVLFARHGIVAGWMAVIFTTLFTLGALALGQWGGTGRMWYGAATAGLAMLVIAIVVLVRARRRFAKLSRRRLELERQLATAVALDNENQG